MPNALRHQGVDAMNNKPLRNFDQIKPFLRMLEGSIDDARKRRLGRDAVSPAPAPSNQAPYRNGHSHSPSAPTPNPIPLGGHGPSTPAPGGGEADRPLRATPIKPKQTLHPPSGFRPTGS